MIGKIDWLGNFGISLFLTLLTVGCQPELTENEKFARFAEQYEKTVGKVFPKSKINLTIDTFVSHDLSKTEILRKVEFCRENLDKLSKLNLEKISPEHTEKLKAIFAELKAYLNDMEAAATKVTD